MLKPLNTLILAPEAHNLAEVTRMLEIAKAVRQVFDVLFISYDGGKRNHHFIEQEGFAIREMQPALTEEKIQYWWRIDRGEEFGDMFSEAELHARIASELALFRETQPAAILTGFCLSIPISARIAKVPLVWVMQTTWLKEYVERYGTWPDAADYAWLQWLPPRWLDYLGARMAPFWYWLLNKGFNKVAQQYGLAPFRGSEMMEGNYNLFAEPPGFSGLEIPERLGDRCRFVGPLIARLDIAMPEQIKSMPRDLPIVYFAMGSSGVENIVVQILRAFEGQPYRVIAPVARLLREAHVTPPANVLVTDWLPADKVNPMASVSVIHGGIGTVMTACLSGTPIVGIPNGNPEQECNIECLVRKGFAVHLSKIRLKAGDVLAAIEHFLQDDQARQKAKDFQSTLQQWNGPAEVARFLEETFHGTAVPNE